jgi:hypothetical protein
MSTTPTAALPYPLFEADNQDLACAQLVTA